MKRILLLIIAVMGIAGIAEAQVGKGQVVIINATANANGTIGLKWPAESWSGTFDIYRRALGSASWGNALTSLLGTANTWTDNTVKKGESYEYLIAKVSGGNTSALGYIWAGNAVPETPGLGGIILLVDSAYLKALAPELSALQKQLNEEGWVVSTLHAGRQEAAQTVRNRIIAEYNRRNSLVKTLLIIGRVPVPYSGNYLAATGQVYPPDGHPDHAGAWPADGYYGDMDGVWTDASVTNTAGSTRNHNKPGDGKFDPTKFPGAVELEVGRVDLFNMPAFSNNDTLLVRKYLRRNMLWRTNRLTTVERALIDDNFGSLNLSSTGFQNFSCMFPFDSIYENRDYISTQKSSPYLWSYGCGGGSNTSCGGIGTTSSFVADSMQNIFTMLAGSYFGDWDQQNNILRAPLCNSALTSSWGGIPKWYVHHMALGKNIGYGAKLSMNNVSDYWSGGFNMSDNKVHIALLGDPTLKMRHLSPVKKVTAVSQNNLLKLTWTKATGKLDGYAVYRYDTAANTYFRVNKNFIIKDTFYNDSSNFNNGKNTYTVRAIRLETTASGTWYNLGAGAFVNVNHLNTSRVVSAQLRGIGIHPNPGNAEVQVSIAAAADKGWKVNITDLTGRTVAEQVIAEGSLSATINTARLSQGCYMVLISHNGQYIAAEKWVKN